MKSKLYWGILDIAIGVPLGLFAVAYFASGEIAWGSVFASLSVIDLTFGVVNLWAAKLEGDIHG